MSVGLSWCCLPLADVTCPKYRSLCWWCLLCPTLMLQWRFTHSMGYVCIYLDDVAFHFPMLLSRCAQITSDARNLWLMQSVEGQRHLTYASRPRTCRRVDAHTPILIRVGLCCCNMPLADLAWSMLIGHIWCHLTYTRRPQVKPSNWCAQTMNEFA